jgi:hypothetical protein
VDILSNNQVKTGGIAWKKTDVFAGEPGVERGLQRGDWLDWEQNVMTSSALVCTPRFPRKCTELAITIHFLR